MAVGVSLLEFEQSECSIPNFTCTTSTAILIALRQTSLFVKPGSSFRFYAPQKQKGLSVRIELTHGITAHFLDLHFDFGMLLRGTSSTLAPVALPSFCDAEVTAAGFLIYSGRGGGTNTAAARMAMAVVQEGDMGLNFAVYFSLILFRMKS